VIGEQMELRNKVAVCTIGLFMCCGYLGYVAGVRSEREDIILDKSSLEAIVKRPHDMLHVYLMDMNHDDKKDLVFDKEPFIYYGDMHDATILYYKKESAAGSVFQYGP